MHCASRFGHKHSQAATTCTAEPCSASTEAEEPTLLATPERAAGMVAAMPGAATSKQRPPFAQALSHYMHSAQSVATLWAATVGLLPAALKAFRLLQLYAQDAHKAACSGQAPVQGAQRKVHWKTHAHASCVLSSECQLPAVWDSARCSVEDGMCVSNCDLQGVSCTPWLGVAISTSAVAVSAATVGLSNQQMEGANGGQMSVQVGLEVQIMGLGWLDEVKGWCPHVTDPTGSQENSSTRAHGGPVCIDGNSGAKSCGKILPRFSTSFKVWEASTSEEMTTLNQAAITGLKHRRSRSSGSGSGRRITLRLRSSNEHLITHVQCVMRQAGNGCATAQVVALLPEHHFTCHHPGGVPSSVVLLRCELWVGEVLLNTVPLISLSPEGSAAHRGMRSAQCTAQIGAVQVARGVCDTEDRVMCDAAEGVTDVQETATTSAGTGGDSANKSGDHNEHRTCTPGASNTAVKGCNLATAVTGPDIVTAGNGCKTTVAAKGYETEAWWWGVSQAAVAAALAELQTFLVALSLGEVGDEGVLSSHLAFLGDLEAWLGAVRSVAIDSQHCFCAGCRGCQTAGVFPRMCPEALMNLGQSLQTHAVAAGLQQVCTMVQQQMRSVVQPWKRPPAQQEQQQQQLLTHPQEQQQVLPAVTSEPPPWHQHLDRVQQKQQQWQQWQQQHRQQQTAQLQAEADQSRHKKNKKGTRKHQKTKTHKQRRQGSMWYAGMVGSIVDGARASLRDLHPAMYGYSCHMCEAYYKQQLGMQLMWLQPLFSLLLLVYCSIASMLQTSQSNLLMYRLPWALLHTAGAVHSILYRPTASRFLTAPSPMYWAFAAYCLHLAFNIACVCNLVSRTQDGGNALQGWLVGGVTILEQAYSSVVLPTRTTLFTTLLISVPSVMLGSSHSSVSVTNGLFICLAILAAPIYLDMYLRRQFRRQQSSSPASVSQQMLLQHPSKMHAKQG